MNALFRSIFRYQTALLVTDHGFELAKRFTPGLLASVVGGLLLLGLWAHRAPAQAPGPGYGPPPAAGPESASPALDAPQAPARLVADVKIVGNRAVSEAKVFAQIRTRKDREFDPEMLQADVRRLNGTSLFRDVRTYTEETEAGVIVTFEVFERPTIRYLKFIGNRIATEKTLTKKSGLAVGEALNLYAVEEARIKLEEYYRSKGHTKIQVTIMEGDDPQDKGVVFGIHEGNLERIAKVEFVGNTIDTGARLKTQIESKPGFMYYFFKGRVDRKKIDQDIEKLTTYYRSLGFFRARIGREMEYDESGQWLTLRFVIDEGPRYVVRNVSIMGNDKFSTEKLEEQLTLKSGQYFNLGSMNRDVGSIRDLYGSQGHIYADITADPRFLEEPGELDLVYRVKEGDVYRVGKINVHIAGEFPHTKQQVVLNRLSIRPGQIIDITEVRNSERRLKSSQLFKADAQTGDEPKIIIPPPELDEAIARQQGGGGGRPAIRGQSPEVMEPRHTVHSHPKEIDIDVYVPEFEDPQAVPNAAPTSAAPPMPQPAARFYQPVYRVPATQQTTQQQTQQPVWPAERRAWPAE